MGGEKNETNCVLFSVAIGMQESYFILVESQGFEFVYWLVENSGASVTADHEVWWLRLRLFYSFKNR